MRGQVITYLFYWLVLVLGQVLVLNNMQISSYLVPYVYVLFLIVLPFETPGWILLVTGFITGVTIDVFPQGWAGDGTTLGIHTFATVLIAYFRPLILRWINPRDEYVVGTRPGASDYGFSWYLIYTVLMVSIHHAVLFLVEDMTFHRLPDVILRTILSVGLTVSLTLIWEGFRYKRRV